MPRKYLLMSGKPSLYMNEAEKVSDKFLAKPFDNISEITDFLRDLPKGSSVLVVDDYDLIRDLVKDVVESSGYIPVVCENCEEALKKFEETGGMGISAVISDIEISPSMNGIKLIRQIKEKYPNE
jgi:response regulator RpfG family c-di-GMP phosphodiesterase